MTSFRLGLRVAGASFAGLLALSGCDGGDDDTGGDTTPTTTNTTATDGGMTDSSGDPADSSSGGGGALTHTADIQPIWDLHCVDACHSSEAGAEWSFLDMSPGEAYAALTDGAPTLGGGLPYITAGDVDMSFLWHKINGTQMDAGGGGLDMPKARPDMEATVLSQDELDTIEAWIAGGAAE